MANSIVNQKKMRKLVLIVTGVLLIVFLIYCCVNSKNPINVAMEIYNGIHGVSQTDPQDSQGSQTTNSQNHQGNQTITNEMEVHFIDVGQADSTLFVHNGKTMLYDVATKSRGDDVANYIKELGYNYIDVLVLTHPHDDHMGGTASFLANMEVGTIYGPDIFDIGLDSGWYEDMIDAIDKIDEERNKGVAEENQTSIWQLPQKSNGEFVEFKIGDAKVQFLAPLEDEYSDMNDYSICAKVTYGTVDIMMTGDATSSVEKALIQEGYDLDVEIFQAGHHGSDTSNSSLFLEAMTPEAIIISCGMKNKHNHPVESVIELYEDMKIPVYRTDEVGDIVMVTDGTNYSFNKPKGTYISGAEYRGE